MHTRFWFVVAALSTTITIAATTQAADTKKKADQLAVFQTETSERALQSRDGGSADENDEGGSRGGGGGGGNDEYAGNGKSGESISAGKKGEDSYNDEETAEVIESIENNDNKQHGSYDEKETVGGWASDKDVEVEPYGRNKKTVVYKKNERNAYEQKEQSKSEYGKLHLSGLAEVIPDQNALTLDQIYEQKHSVYESNTRNGQQRHNNNQQQILALLKFGRDFESWNPRNPTSQWEWFGTEGGAPADNAAYVLEHSGEEEGGYQKKHSAYGTKKKHRNYVVQYSLPFSKYYNSSDPNNRYSFYEGVVQTKNNLSIGPTERFLYRLKFSCKILNADKHPFPSSQVSNPWNDPRLGTCGLGITDNDSGLFFFIRATNTGVWAQYGRRTFPNQTQAQNFFTQRLVGRRARYDTVVDGAIEIDRRAGKVNYYLNGYLVWTIYAIGFLPPDDSVTVINRGEGDPQISSISSVKVNFGTYKGLDSRDPNNRYNTQPLVRVRGNSTNYGANDTFYDENNLKGNQLWGQGAVMTLLKLISLKAESLIPPQHVLPGIYGDAEQPKYQKASPYKG